MTNPASSSNMSMDVLKDLSPASALQSLLTNQGGLVFQILGELATYASQPISQAAAAKASASINPSKAATWKTSNGIGFSLTPTAQCKIGISFASESYPIAMKIESNDPKDTEVVLCGPSEGLVYINVDLDFDIQGTISGTGAVGALGVSGKVSGDKNATLSFSQPVEAAMNTLEAVKLAFEQLVCPLDPGCMDRMQPRSIVKVSFDGSFNCEVDVTYGLGSYKVSAPDLNSVKECLQNIGKLTDASATADVGVKGTVSYCHTSHFALIVTKTTASAAMVYLVRSSEAGTSESAGVSAQVSSCAPTLTLDPTKLAAVAQKITGSSLIASAVLKAITTPANDLGSLLNGKLKGWASSTSESAGLSVGLDQQSGHTALFVFVVDTTNKDARIGWTELIGGSVSRALGYKGFTLQQGSGVADNLKHTATLKFQFFNFFSFSSTTDYFSNGYVELGKDGAIHILRDIGKEREDVTKIAMKKFRIYFEATARQGSTSAEVTDAEVDLCLEFSEKADSKYALALAKVLKSLPGSDAVSTIEGSMVSFLHGKPSGSLDLKFTLRSTAYERLSADPFLGKTPPSLPQQKDSENWAAFQRAAGDLVSDVPFVAQLTYAVWRAFNVDSWDEVGSERTPDRHQTGNSAVVPLSLLAPYGPPNQVGYFLEASQSFMNLCDDLRMLAAGIPNVETSAQWQGVLATLTAIMTKDVYVDYGVPTCAGLLALCSGQTSGTVLDSSDGKSLTCLLTIS